MAEISDDSLTGLARALELAEWWAEPKRGSRHYVIYSGRRPPPGHGVCAGACRHCDACDVVVDGIDGAYAAAIVAATMALPDLVRDRQRLRELVPAARSLADQALEERPRARAAGLPLGETYEFRLGVLVGLLSRIDATRAGASPHNPSEEHASAEVSRGRRE